MSGKTPRSAVELAARLRKVWDDKEFVIGTLSSARTEEDREVMIDYLKTGKDITVESITALSLILADKRREREKKNK